MMLKKLVVLTALAIGSFAAAHADSINGTINLTGVASYNNPVGQITFAPNSGVITGFGTTTLDFASFAGLTGSAINFHNFSYSSFVSPSPVFDATTGGSTVAFGLNSISFAGLMNGAFVVDGTGTFTLTGFDPTPGVFSFTTQAGQTVASFSSTTVAAPTPEPASLALFGTGLLGIVGVARRKLRV